MITFAKITDYRTKKNNTPEKMPSAGRPGAHVRISQDTDMRPLHYIFLLYPILLFTMLAGCKGTGRKTADTPDKDGTETVAGYDLPEIQEAGELIAATVSGPETYFEYRGRGFGLQFDLAERFAISIGTRLRMEVVGDTAELLRRLCHNEIDLVALELPADLLVKNGLRQAGAWSGDSTANGKKRQWVIRQASKQLGEALDRWYSPQLRAVLMEKEQRRQTAGNATSVHRRAPMLNRRKGIISAYDQHFVRHSAPIGWDWRLMAAQCYQESGFDPHAISWAGARGLMQIMPETADLLGIPVGHLNDPGTNIKAAAQYIRKLQETFSDIPGRVDRIRFILAAYNGGAGHVRDAMTLAQKHGKDSRRWEDVAPFILKLSEPRYYNRPDMKFGYLRGSETYNYVNDIMRRWEQYRNAADAKVSSATGDIRPAMPRGFKSKVLSPEEMEAKYRDEKEETAETGETAPADNQKETEE